METLNLTKTIYGATKAQDSLDKEFVEFVPKPHTIDDLFNLSRNNNKTARIIKNIKGLKNIVFDNQIK